MLGLQWSSVAESWRLIDIYQCFDIYQYFQWHYQRLSTRSAVLIRHSVLWVTLSNTILCYCCRQCRMLIAVNSVCDSPDCVKLADQLLWGERERWWRESFEILALKCVFNDNVLTSGTSLVLNKTFRISCWPSFDLITSLLVLFTVNGCLFLFSTLSRIFSWEYQKWWVFVIVVTSVIMISD